MALSAGVFYNIVVLPTARNKENLLPETSDQSNRQLLMTLLSVVFKATV